MIKFPTQVKLTDWLFALALALYFLMNGVSLIVAGVALYWYVEAMQPVVDWIDPDGPGYRLLEVTPARVQVRWIELQLLVDCPGRTEIAVIGERFATHIDAYPFVIERVRRTFVRNYPLPEDCQRGIMKFGF